MVRMCNIFIMLRKYYFCLNISLWLQFIFIMYVASESLKQKIGKNISKYPKAYKYI